MMDAAPETKKNTEIPSSGIAVKVALSHAASCRESVTKVMFESDPWDQKCSINTVSNATTRIQSKKYNLDEFVTDVASGCDAATSPVTDDAGLPSSSATPRLEDFSTTAVLMLSP
jgi:hypothetical protein